MNTLWRNYQNWSCLAFALRESLRTSFAYPKYELNRTYNAPNQISNQTNTSLMPAYNQEITTYRKCLTKSYVAVIIYQHFCCTSFDIYTFSFLVSSYWFSCKDSLHEWTFVLKIERVQRSTINQVVVSVGEILLGRNLKTKHFDSFYSNQTQRYLDQPQNLWETKRCSQCNLGGDATLWLYILEKKIKYEQEILFE